MIARFSSFLLVFRTIEKTESAKRALLNHAMLFLFDLQTKKNVLAGLTLGSVVSSINSNAPQWRACCQAGDYDTGASNPTKKSTCRFLYRRQTRSPRLDAASQNAVPGGAKPLCCISDAKTALAVMGEHAP